MAILKVGAGETFTTLSSAIAASRDGDAIQVDAGTYTDDFASINTKITIEGVGGMANLVADVPPPDGKAILTINTDVTIINMSFSGAAAADNNGAGIRYQGGNLVLDNTYFHNNQNGLLGAADPTGTITIMNSEFADNGVAPGNPGSGFTHNIYVGAIATLTITDSYFHDAVVGHEIKSRATNNIIENNRIGEGPTGNGSYDIDLPNGGDATIMNNVIEKGPSSPNEFMISYGEEGTIEGVSNQLNVTANTVLNDRTAAILVRDEVGGGSVSITDNQIYTGSNSFRFYNGPDNPSTTTDTFLAAEPAFDTSDPFLPVAPVCFVKGTHILTARGEVAVEMLRPGDPVVTMTNGIRDQRPVKWIGHRRLDLTTHNRPATVMPVRIVRSAMAENVPHRDLLVSPDHAVFIDGVLIVARQLINGRTIRWDSAAGSVGYFHVELAAHGILLAEGLPAESYLDTGNRGFFANSGAPLTLHPDLTEMGQERRVLGSCAPFRTDERTVQPVWQRLADRADRLGYGAQPCSTKDPDLRLLVAGRQVRAVYTDGERYLFAVPSGVVEARLLSRASPPAECRPWLDDPRRLGVSVGRIVLRARDHVEEVALDHPVLCDGWWKVEHTENTLRRWTDGNALLPLSPYNAPAALEIRLNGEMTYPRFDETEPDQTNGMESPTQSLLTGSARSGEGLPLSWGSRGTAIGGPKITAPAQR